ncbi:MAG: hypothetical protein N2Z76_00805 [Treponemataceae bacterium]|nr:hypothetical protein [Treponemataceae bacterium]
MKIPFSLLKISRAWWSNEGAISCGELSWPLVLVTFVTSALALALPFWKYQWQDYQGARNIKNYAGLGNAFETVATISSSFRVQGEKLVGYEAPFELHSNDWTIMVGYPGLPIQNQKILWLGRDYLAITNPEKEISLYTRWNTLSPFSSTQLTELAHERRTLRNFIEGLVYRLSLFHFLSSSLGVFFLLIAQNTLYIFILGFLLSLSVKNRFNQSIPAAFTLRTAIKSTICAVSGICFILGILGFWIPSISGGYLWLAYSLLSGIRILLLYTSCYTVPQRT